MSRNDCSKSEAQSALHKFCPEHHPRKNTAPAAALACFNGGHGCAARKVTLACGNASASAVRVGSVLRPHWRRSTQVRPP
jgi:hypothetical protein